MIFLGKCQDCRASLFWSEEEEKLVREHPAPDPGCLCHVRKNSEGEKGNDTHESILLKRGF